MFLFKSVSNDELQLRHNLQAEPDQKLLKLFQSSSAEDLRNAIIYILKERGYTKAEILLLAQRL